ncbi:histone-like nucleoid-structuring protein Lsr2 [Streptomyces sp. NPDC048638]|uniref:Lsr2 family DNA-binding protein n=1 Tax=Streptomyces sp. NPDC048638 TaxID=3365580 RepID=UPI00371C48DE
MRNITEVRNAFEKLPQHVTTTQIAEATDRTHVHNWVKDPTFPGEVDRKGRTVLRDRDAVLDWYVEQPFAQTDRRSGPGNVNARVLNAHPTQVMMGSAALADLLDLTRRAVNKYADRYPAESADPFPLADPDGNRSWSEVRAWFLRKSDPMPTAGKSGKPAWAKLRVWLRRHVNDGSKSVTGHVYLDELGLTLGQRDVIERARLARAREASVPVEWLAEVLHLEEPGQAEWLESLLSEPDAVPVVPSMEVSPRLAQGQLWLKQTALARELGVSVESLKYFARTYVPETSEDPYPDKDSSSARDVAEVRAWLVRHRKMQPSEADIADAGTDEVTAVRPAVRRSDATAIRTWAIENGHEVKPRGPLPQEIRDLYQAAQAASVLDIVADAPLSPAEAAHAARLLDLAATLQVDPSDLDKAVHDAAAGYVRAALPDADDDEAGRQAADVSNGGLARQVPYLVAHNGHEQTERIIRQAA